jgi:hypothetical protein
VEFNLTESALKLGIKFNSIDDQILQIAEKNITETSSEYLLMTDSSRIFMIIVYN